MARKTNLPSALSLANGTNLVRGSTGNTGGAAGAYADDVVLSGTGSATFQSGAYRFNGGASGDVARWEWTGHSSDVFSARIRFAGIASAPSANSRLIEPRGSDYMLRVDHTPADKIRALDGSNVERFVSAGSVPSTPFAIGVRGRRSTGEFHLDLYLTGDGLGGTPDETHDVASGFDLDVANFQILRVGKLTTGVVASYDVLALDLDDTTLARLPAVGAAPSISLGPDLTVEPMTTVTLTATHTSGPAPDSWTWAPLSGPAVTLSPSGATCSFTAPSDKAGTAVAIGCTPATSGVSGAQDALTVTARPQLLWVRESGVWKPLGPTTFPAL